MRLISFVVIKIGVQSGFMVQNIINFHKPTQNCFVTGSNPKKKKNTKKYYTTIQ